MLKYCLRENLLTAKPDDYMAQVTDSQVFTLEDVIDRMVKRGTTVTRTDLAALMQLYTQECTYIVEEGGTLNTSLINTSFSISGVFAVAGTKTVRCASVVENKPARLIVILDPAVKAGNFTLEVRTKLTGNGSQKSKTIKKGYYHKSLKAIT